MQPCDMALQESIDRSAKKLLHTTESNKHKMGWWAARTHFIVGNTHRTYTAGQPHITTFTQSVFEACKPARTSISLRLAAPMRMRPRSCPHCAMIVWKVYSEEGPIPSVDVGQLAVNRLCVRTT